MMNFHIMTLFPEMVEEGLNTSILKRAIDKELISIKATQIRDFTNDKHNKVDDYTYGGGAGMLMQAQPIFDCHESIQNEIIKSGQKKAKVILLSPRGYTFNQKMAKEFSQEENLIFLCGHYEGIDERVIEEIVTDSVSIGDYVLTGGELAAMVMIDAIARLVPGVLNNSESSETESFSDGLLEYPQYTRPEVWHEKSVPEILLSGHHENVNKWRLEKSLEETKKYRPDMYEEYMALHPPIEKKKRKRRKNTEKNEE